MTQVKYIIDDKQISFYQNNEIKIITEQAWFAFESLKQALISNGAIGSLMLSAKACLEDLISQRSEKFGIKQRLEALEQANLPTEPFKNFVSRVGEDFLRQHPEFIGKAGSVDAPLTWDGDLIMYQRAAWRDQNKLSNWANDEEFTAFKTLEGETRVSEFNAALNVCADTGMVYEVIVQPEHLVGRSGVYQGLWTVSQVTQLAKLGLRPVDKQADTGIVDVMTNCISEQGNAIRLPFNASTAAKLVGSLFDNQTQHSQVNNIVPVRLALSSC